MVGELRPIGAHVRLAEPADTSARRGTKKRGKNDGADARHLRELVMVGRLPASWIPADHLLGLRARVRLRQTLSDRRGEWAAHPDGPLHCPGADGASASRPRSRSSPSSARRFSSSREAVRHAGLDITVQRSDRSRAPGHRSCRGPPALRWALFEAAQVARCPASPDRHYYVQAAERLGANRACLSIARKLLKRSHHTLRELGEEAPQPA